MNANRYHALRPTPLTAADHARMVAAVAAHDKRISLEAAKNRLYRLGYHCGCIALFVAFFYGVTN